MRPDWPLKDRLIYNASRVIERLTGGHARIVRYYFVAQGVHDRPLVSFGGATRFYRATAVDAMIRQALRPEQVILRRFADGAVCFTAATETELAGFVWVQEKEYFEDEVRCSYSWQPSASAAWDFDVYVAPHFRGTRVFARLWEYTSQFLRVRGYRWTVSRISAFKPASLAAHRRIGILPLGSGTFIVLGPVQLSFFTRSPYFHLSVRSGQVPRLTFDLPGNTARSAVPAPFPEPNRH